MVFALIGATVMGLLFTGLGLYMFWNKYRLIQKAEPVEARVIDTRIRKKRKAGHDNRGQTYYPKVRYEYYIDGAKHQSSSVYPGGEVGQQTEDAAREEITDFAEGQTVTAYVDPDDLDTSFLLKENSWVPLVLVLFGLVILGVAVSMVL